MNKQPVYELVLHLDPGRSEESSPKHILTVGFVLGALGLVVKFIDERVAPERKQRFDAWIKINPSTTRELTIEKLRLWARLHRGQYFMIWGLSAPALAIVWFYLPFPTGL
jgi:hypothetical protein